MSPQHRFAGRAPGADEALGEGKGDGAALCSPWAYSHPTEAHLSLSSFPGSSPHQQVLARFQLW